MLREQRGLVEGSVWFPPGTPGTLIRVLLEIWGGIASSVAVIIV